MGPALDLPADGGVAAAWPRRRPVLPQVRCLGVDAPVTAARLAAAGRVCSAVTGLWLRDARCADGDGVAAVVRRC